MRHSIYVVTHDNQWKVTCKHCDASVLENTQSSAIETAKRHVADLPATTISQILVQGQNSQFRAEWTYGNDPFPPKG